MQAAILYILKSICLTALPVIYYYLFLRNKKLYRFNRLYLLAIVPLSLLLPLLKIEWLPVQYTAAMDYPILNAISSSAYEAESLAPSPPIRWEGILLMVIISVSVFLLLMFIRKMVWVYSIKCAYPSTAQGSATIVNTDLQQAPFSFLSTIYWRNDISLSSDMGQKILVHELTHVRLKHSLDKLFMQAVIIFLWINPFYWLINKELTLQHEFAADETATGGDSRILSLMLLHTHFSSGFSQIVHSFFNSSIKRRLSMISQTNKTNYSFLRKVMVAPLMCLTVLFFSYDAHPPASPPAHSARKIKVVFDAGHGGEIEGGMGAAGVVEKDLALRITQNIISLAASYNIEAIPLRTTDKTLSLRDRTKMAEESGGELYVSIHVNKITGQLDQQEAYSAVISSDNKHYAESKELASAVIARLGQSGMPFVLVDRGDHVWVLRENKLPAILLECGNIDNASDVNKINSNESLEKMSRSILSGIVDYSAKKIKP